MADWYVNVNAPMITGEYYNMIIDTKDGTKISAELPKYPDGANCHVVCKIDPTGSSRLSVRTYKYDRNADYRKVNFTAFLDVDAKGTESTDVQED